MCALRRRDSLWFVVTVLVVVLLQSASLLGNTEAQLLVLQSKLKSSDPNLRYCHLGMLNPPDDRPVREAWIALDDRGNVSAVQVNLHDRKQSLVWTEAACQTWRLDTNELFIFRDHLYTLKMLSFATRHHPGLVYTRLGELVTEPNIKVHVEEVNDANDPIKITVTYAADTYLVGAPKIPMRDVYTVDPATGHLSKTEVYAYVQRQYRKAATWVHFDAVKPSDPNVFDLRRQIHSGVRIVDTSDVEYGVKQDDSSDEEVAAQVVEAFLAAWESQDTESIRKLLGYVIPSSADKFCETVTKRAAPRVVKIGDPFKKAPYLGLFVPVTVEVGPEPAKQSQITFLASPKDRDRWHIAQFNFEPSQSDED